jgi:hypothetical protein
MINPYKIVQEILMTHSKLNTIAHESFESLAPESRVKLNDLLLSLLILARNIETYADEQFTEGETL